MSERYYVPSFVSVHRMKDAGAGGEYVLCNELTGQYFRANAPTLNLLEKTRKSGSLSAATAALNLPQGLSRSLAEELMRAGIIVQRRSTAQAAVPNAPLESGLIAFRMNVMDIGRLIHRLRGLGDAFFTPVAFVLWICAIVAALAALAARTDKMRLMLNAPEAFSAQAGLYFLAVFVGLKVIHELGHGMAYRTFCARAGLDPGPIRVGIAVFALTPFPFTNVTGAWRLPSRWQRAAISAGGMYLESFAIAVATLIWAFTAPGPLQLAFLQAAIVSGGLTFVFNLNPAVKLDGYYILSDLSGRDNLAGRGSRAAMTTFARVLGADLPAADRIDVLYWTGSFLYRAVLFTSIFWLAFAFDPGLAVPVAIAAIMLLVVRPLIGAIRFAKSQKLRARRVVPALLTGAGLAALAVVPLPDWFRFDGRLERFETQLVFAPASARFLGPEGGAIRFQNPELTADLQDATARLAILESATRALAATGADRLQLENDRDRAADFVAQLNLRQAALSIALAQGSIWTELGARTRAGQWVLPGAEQPLGAISQPSPPHLLLWRDQGRLDGDAVSSDFAVRLYAEPRCQFSAQLVPGREEITGAHLVLRAVVSEPMPDCLAAAASGAAVTARLDRAPSPLWRRAWLAFNRVMQDRLPTLNVSTSQASGN